MADPKRIQSLLLNFKERPMSPAALETSKTTRIASEATLSQFGPTLKTAIPGPLAQKIIADDARLMSPSYTRSYPMVAKSGRSVRGRQRISRLLRGHRSELNRTLSP
jgi:hypothetical protein